MTITASSMPRDSPYIIRAFTDWYLHRLVSCYNEYRLVAACCDPKAVAFAEDDEILEAFITDRRVVLEDFRHMWNEFAYFCRRYRVYIDREIVYFDNDFKEFIEVFK